MLNRYKTWIGLGLTLILLIIFLVTVDVAKMFDALTKANYVFILPAIAMYLISTLFRTIRWKTLLAHMKEIKVARLYPVVVVGYMANNILPMRLGEFVRSYYLSEREGVSVSAALATVFVERVIDALTLLIFIIVIALIVPLGVGGIVEGLGERSGIAWPFIVSAATVPFVLSFSILMIIARYPQATLMFTFKIFSILPKRFRAVINDLAKTFVIGLSALKSPQLVLKMFLVSIPIWLFESTLFYLIGISFDFHHHLGGHVNLAMISVLVTAITNIGSSVPAAPGGIGLFELIARETLVLIPLGIIDRSVAAGYAAVVHATLLIPMIVLGQVILWSDNISINRLWLMGKNNNNEVSD